MNTRNRLYIIQNCWSDLYETIDISEVGIKYGVVRSQDDRCLWARIVKFGAPRNKFIETAREQEQFLASKQTVDMDGR